MVRDDVVAQRSVPMLRPGRPREFEICRIAGRLGPGDVEAVAAEARVAVLRWAQKRRGTPLPAEAWNGKSFDYLAGGRNCVGVRLLSNSADLWALRADDPDKNVPGRVWTTEIVIGAQPGDHPRIGVRLFASSNEDSLRIEAASPGFIRQIIDAVALFAGSLPCSGIAWWLNEEEEVEELVQQLLDPARTLPLVLVTTGDAGWEESALPFQPDALASAMAGIAHIAVMPEPMTWRFTQLVGRGLSVFDGGVRIYQPGFSADDDPYGPHDLILAKEISTPEAAQAGVVWLRNLLADNSVKRQRLGKNTISFQDVRDAVIAQTQQQLLDSGAGADELLRAADQRIASLDDQLRSGEDWTRELESENQRFSQDIAQFKTAANKAKVRIAQLEQALRQKGVTEAVDPAPTEWGDLADWCDRNYAARIVLTPAARRGLKAAQFEDIGVATRAISWLATVYRDARMYGGQAGERDAILEEGIRNAPCGGDTYEIKWQGEATKVDWHVKNGGTTRDPKRCFRAYHFWDNVNQQVVVDLIPAHQTTGAS